MADVVLEGRFDTSHARRYTHVPFEVPPGVAGLHVAYDYTDRIASDPLLSGGNTLDIGLFDPRGIEPSSAGFRGWSGSHKLEFTVAEEWATPPYLPGPLLAGTWHLLLGPYKVGPHGCDYAVTIDFLESAPLPERRSYAVETRKRRHSEVGEPGWLRGDLHCHTLFSDGDSWPAEMLGHALERGLDFLGVTDHNQVGHQADYARATGADLPILLPGVEVTTYGGHWNAWGTDTWWEFREPTEEATSRAMRLAAASGALVSINHPKPFGPAWEYPGAEGYHAVEVWNGAWERLNHVSLAYWENQLRGGRRLVALGGSDTHRLKEADADSRHGRMLGLPTTWAQVDGEPTADSVLAALRAGRVFISHDVAGPQLYLSASEEGLRIRAVDARGAMLQLISSEGVAKAASVTRDDWSETFARGRGYVRAQLVDRYAQLLALTNPLFESD